MRRQRALIQITGKTFTCGDVALSVCGCVCVCVCVYVGVCVRAHARVRVRVRVPVLDHSLETLLILVGHAQVDLDFGTDEQAQDVMAVVATLITRLTRLRELGLTLNSSFGDWFAGVSLMQTG